MTGLQLKQFFKRQFKMAVLARAGKNYCEVRIKPNPYANVRDSITYPYLFSPELGNQCMRIVYPNSGSLAEQAWGGNVSCHSIAMSPRQWAQLVALYEVGVDHGGVVSAL